MKQLFTSLSGRSFFLLLFSCLLLAANQATAQTTATEEFENETSASTFSESGINFNHTFSLVTTAGYGYAGSNKYLELAMNGAIYSKSVTISINNSLNPSVSYKINSFAAYTSASGAGAGPYNGEVTVSGTPVGSSTLVSAVINIASLSGTLPSGQTRDANGVVNGLNFNGTSLAGLYFTSLTFTVNDNNPGDGSIGTRYFEFDHMNFTTQVPSTNQYSISDTSVLEGSSGTKFMTIKISRTDASAAGSVQVQSSNGTAVAPGDYTAFPLTTVNFTAGGPLTQTVNVTINGDLTPEADETFTMTLSNATGGTIFDGTATGTILDDDNITETFEDETVPTNQISTVRNFSERGFSFTSNGALYVSRGNYVGAGSSNANTVGSALDTRVGDGGSTGNVGSFYISSPGASFDLNSIDVFLSNNDGNSGAISSVNVTFTGVKADGTGNVSYTATLPAFSQPPNYIFQNISFAGTPLNNIQLSSVSVTLGIGANYISIDNINYGTVSFSTGTQLSIDDVTVVEGTGGGSTTAVFTITRTNNTSAFTVNVATSDLSATSGSDYVAVNTTLNFTNGGSLTQTVPVTIVRDAVIEGTETFNVTLSAATNGVTYQKQVGLGTILDDDKVVETFEDETNNAITFSENGFGFSANGRLKVVYGSNGGSGLSRGYLSSGDNASGGSVGKISVVNNSNTGFKLLQLDMLTYKGIGTANSIESGPVTFIGTLLNGSTVSTTKTITPTALSGNGFQQNITFTGTPLDNVVLTSLEFVAGGAITTIDIDNLNYVAVVALPFAEVTDAANVAIPNGSAASTTNNTDFGSACTGSGTVSKTFTIKNTGGANLTLSGSPLAVLGGANANQFTITTQPTSPIAAGGSTTFTVSYIPNAAGTHNAIITLTSNDAANNPYVINIKGTATTPPSIATAPASTTVCAGTTTTFTVVGSGDGTLSYQWYKGSTALTNGATGTGSTIAGATTTTLTITNPGSSDVANYNVRVSSSTGCTPATSGNATLSVNSLPSFSTQPTSITSGACAGNPVSFTAAGTGSGTLSYQWYKGSTALTNGTTGSGSIISGATTATLTISNPSPSDNATNYNVIVSSSTGCMPATSNNTTLTVTPPATATATTSGTKNISSTNTLITSSACSVIANVAPSGTAQVSGSTTATVTVQSSVQVYSSNGSPYAPRYYDIVPATNASTATATLTLYYNQSEFTAYNAYPGHGLNLPVDATDAANYKANIRIYQFHGTPNGSGTFPGATTEAIDPADANIVWNSTYSRWEITFNVTGFSRFYLASAGSTILPLDLLNFIGSTDGYNVWLQWKTANEKEVSYFEIERSTDAQHFEKIGQLSAGGNTYRATDKPGANPTYYYRLKIVDKDGRYSYSNVVAVNMKKATMVIQAMPNPFKDRLLVQITTAGAAKVELRLLEMSGKTILKKTVVLQPGINTISLDETSALSKGSYLLQVSGEKVNSSLNVIKAE